MNDLISRQAAIDALADYIHNVDKVMGTGHLTEDDCKDAAASVFEELPSVQTEVEKDTNVPINDCISRQAAIDGADAIITRDTSGNNDVVKAMTAWKRYVEALPTVEGRKKGKWIIRDNPGTGWYRVTCSECGEDVTSTVPVIGFFPDAKVLWDYCPYCGSFNGGAE